jgi:hypothetical protein
MIGFYDRFIPDNSLRVAQIHDLKQGQNLSQPGKTSCLRHVKTGLVLSNGLSGT